jgi:hypothetical protein
VRLRRSLFRLKPSFSWRPSDYTSRYRSAWAANRSMLWPSTPAAEGSSHPDRNAQFEHINAEVLAAKRLASPSFPWIRRKKKHGTMLTKRNWTAGCGVREESWNELASESLVRSKPSRQDGSESFGRRGNAGSEA